MRDRDTINIPSPFSFGNNSANLLYCHLRVNVIFQIANLLTSCIVTYHTFKDNNTSCPRVANGGNKGIAIKWLSSNLNEWLQLDVPDLLVCPTTYRRDKNNLIALVEH